MTQPIEPRYEVLTWDWKEQADFIELAKLVEKVTGAEVYFTEVEDTGGDSFAVVVSNVRFSAAEGNERFDNWCELR